MLENLNQLDGCKSAPHALAEAECVLRNYKAQLRPLADALGSDIRAALKNSDYSPSFKESTLDRAIRELIRELELIDEPIAQRAAELDRQRLIENGHGCPKCGELMVLKACTRGLMEGCTSCDIWLEIE